MTFSPITQLRYNGVNWSDPASKISKYFTVKDAIWLSQWGRLANEKDGLQDRTKRSLFRFFNLKADKIRERIGKPVFTKSCYRPTKYNKLIGGATASSHMCLGTDQEDKDFTTVAWDFWANVDGDNDKDGADCDAIKKLLIPELSVLNIRMENNGAGANWVHVDTRWSNGNRYFLP